MAEKRKTAAECRAELGSLSSEYAAVNQRIADLEGQLLESKKRLRELAGVWNDDGEIRRAQRRLAAAEKWEADQVAPRVVWVGESPRLGWDENGEWVLVKVTPKRIFIRVRGSSREEQYLRDGASRYGDYRIDVPATLKGTKWEAQTPAP